jgi:hypothetical protein
MTPATKRAKLTDGALRAAKEIERNPSFIESTAEVIDRETGVRELVEILENIIAETGDLIESRSPSSLPKPTLRFGITATNPPGKKNDARFRMSRRTFNLNQKRLASLSVVYPASVC